MPLLILIIALTIFPYIQTASASPPSSSGTEQVQPVLSPKLTRSTDVKSCNEGKPCGDACIAITATCNLPPAAQAPAPVTIKKGDKPPVITPHMLRSTDITACPPRKKPCGDSCISSTASCNLDK